MTGWQMNREKKIKNKSSFQKESLRECCVIIIVKWLLHFSFVLADRCRVPVVTSGSLCKFWAVAYDGGLQIWERGAEVHVSDWVRAATFEVERGSKGVPGRTVRSPWRDSRRTKEKEWKGGEEGEKGKRREVRHSHDGSALPVRRYVAVPRCPLGPVGWHSYWVSSNLGVLRRCQQGS